MRDIIFNLTRVRFTSVYYHLLFWIVFVFYEITLAAAIREKFNHFLDYLVHYLLNIALFYIHCYAVLGKKQFNKISEYKQGLLYLLLEVGSYYLLSLLFNKLLIISGIPVNVPDSSSRLFQLSVLYRCLYFIGLATAFRIALHLVDNRERIHQYITQNLIAENEKAILRAELATAELSFLRSQVNPHFLFNSLNSVYNRIRKKDPQGGEYVMALADLMQYALQPLAATDEVPLESELEHIGNYIKLQKLRYSADVDFKLFKDDRELKIIPLLLITLIENVFQHGEFTDERYPNRIEINISGGKLTLLTHNRVRPDHRPGHGLGLVNTRKRLQHHYPGHYILEYGVDRDVFNLKLIVKLS